MQSLWTATTQIHKYFLEKYTDPFQLAAVLRSQTANLEARKVLGLDPPSLLIQIEPRSGRMSSVSIVEGTLDHLDYIVGVIGIDHVGIGTDIDMKREDYIWIYQELVSGMLERGYTEGQIGKILGANFLRVFRANEG